MRKKKKSKNKEHIGKNIKTDINNTDCVSLFWKFMYIHKYRTREREGRKNVRSYGMTQEQKTHSPWNALQDNENISIIKTHRTTCAAKMSNNAFLFLWQTRSRVIYKRYVRATELFNLYQNDLLPLQFCVYLLASFVYRNKDARKKRDSRKTIFLPKLLSYIW